MDILWSFFDKCSDCTPSQLLTAVIGAVLAAWTLKQLVFGCEATPVAYQVPIPAEISDKWDGKTWDDVGVKDREILECQANGVSLAW